MKLAIKRRATPTREGNCRLQAGSANPASETRRAGAHGLQRSVHAASEASICAWLGVVIGVLLIGGCTVGPDYRRPAALPSAPLPSAFGDAAVTNSTEWKTAEPSAHLSQI